MTWVATAVVGGSVISGTMAQKGAQTQADAMKYSADVQRQMFDVQNAQQAPYRQVGYNALNQIGKLGSGTYGIYDENGNVTGQGTGTDYLTRQFSPEDFQAGIDPSYNWRLQQGNLAITNLKNQSGGLIGGNALQGLTDYGQNAASQEFGNVFNRFQSQRTGIYNTLASIAGLGQTSLGQTTAASTTAGGNIGSAISGAGSATGAGQVAMGNAIGGGIQTLGNQQYLNNLVASNRGTGIPTPAGYGTPVNVPAPTGVPYNVA